MEEMLRASKALAATFCRTGETYEDAARRIMDYDTQSYMVPAVFMSPVVAAFLRALADADGSGASATGPAYPSPSYGPSLRETG